MGYGWRERGPEIRPKKRSYPQVTKESPCNDNSLDALLTDDCPANHSLGPNKAFKPHCEFALKPRSVYHVYAMFAEMTGSKMGALRAGDGPSFSFVVLGLLACTCYPDRAATGPHFVPGLPHVTLIELRLALISYQDYHILLLTLAGCGGVVDGVVGVGVASAGAVNVTVLVGQALSTAATVPTMLHFSGLPASMRLRVETARLAAGGRAASHAGGHPTPPEVMTTDSAGTLEVSLAGVVASDVHRVRLTSTVETEIGTDDGGPISRAPLKSDDAATKAWWQWGAAPYPLEVPLDLARRATPIWAPNVSAANTTCKTGKLPGGARGPCAAWPQFVLARKEFKLPSKSPLRHAVAFVTAQQSEFCPPDQYMDGWNGSRHLELGDYGSCIYPGGTTQPKLLGAYRLSINGVLVGMGPGRRVNQTQGVDALDVTSTLAEGGNCVALQGFHTNRWGAHPRFMLLLRLTFLDGTVQDISTAESWRTRDADLIFNPEGNTGAWAVSGPWYSYGAFPQEMIDMPV